MKAKDPESFLEAIKHVHRLAVKVRDEAVENIPPTQAMAMALGCLCGAIEVLELLATMGVPRDEEMTRAELARRLVTGGMFTKKGS